MACLHRICVGKGTWGQGHWGIIYEKDIFQILRMGALRPPPERRCFLKQQILSWTNVYKLESGYTFSDHLTMVTRKEKYIKIPARIFGKNENCQQKFFLTWPKLIPYNFDPALYRNDYILQQQWGNNIKWVVPIFKKGYAMACLLKNVIEIMINQCAWIISTKWFCFTHKYSIAANLDN